MSTRSVSVKRRLGSLVVSTVVFVAAGCADSEAGLAEPTRDELVAAHVESGLPPDVADCLVGIGTRELDAGQMAPDAVRDPDDELLVASLVESCQEAADFVSTDDEPVMLAFVDGPHDVGDDPALDHLWTRCDAGDGVACDELWSQAPIGSAYERFGVTCGQRPAVLDCGEELTPETAARLGAEESDTTESAVVAASPDTTVGDSDPILPGAGSWKGSRPQ